jgi:hypothetical protein
MAVTIQCGGKGYDNGGAAVLNWETVPEVALIAGFNYALTPSETAAARVVRTPGTFKRLASRDNATGTGRSYRLRKNLADATMIMSLPDSTAGTTTDTTHADRYANGDKFDLQVQGSAVFGNYWMMVQFYADNGTVTEAVTPNTNTGTAATLFWFHGQGLDVANNALPARAAYVASKFQFYSLVANATSFAVVSMKGATVGNASISIPASTTGLFEDTTHSDSVAVGDLFAMRATTTGAVTGTTVRLGWAMTYAGIASEMEFAPVYTVSAGSGATTYLPIAGTSWGDGTEANAQQAFGFGGTVSKLRMNFNSADNGSNVFTVRKNGVNQTVTITVASGASGLFEDTTHTDRFLPTDLMCVSDVESGGFFGALGLLAGLILLTPDPEVLRAPQRHYLRR